LVHTCTVHVTVEQWNIESVLNHKTERGADSIFPHLHENISSKEMILLVVHINYKTSCSTECNYKSCKIL